MKPLEKGGRQIYFLVPENEIPEKAVSKRKKKPPEVAEAEVVKYDPTIPDLTPSIKVPEHELYRAQLKAALCEKLLTEFKNGDAKIKVLSDILEAYNSGYLLPELYKLEGRRTERTLRIWLKTYEESDRDFKSLVRLSKASSYKKATEVEQNFLLGLLLDANKIKIGSAIRKLKQLHRLKAIESPTSERALRRWVESWRDEHSQQWNLLRKGKKYSKDKGILSLLRDEVLEVGDVWVADGHKLAFDIIDPISGKPKRMMLILFFDWGSRYPVGASIANSEDSEHILLALRNGILHWGGKPKFVYLDNGKAFKSKLFHEKWENHDFEKELCGIFPRLDIEVEFAKAYNARAKVVERFFRTFQEDFERYMDTFRGSGIADKPAFLMRNEKWIKSLRRREPLSLDQAKQLMSVYIQDYYGKTPHGGLAGKTPLEVFQAAKVPADRKIESSELNFMLLKIEQRTVNANGIQLANIIFYNDHLMQFVGKKVYLRYDLMDMRSILVYDEDEKLICQAFARKSSHPFVELAKDKPMVRRQWQKQLAHQRKLEKTLKESSAAIRKQVDDATSEFMIPHIKMNKKIFNNTPLIQHNVPADPDVNIENLSHEPKIVPQRLSEEEQGIKALDKLFNKIGI
ncbi:MAG: hypothetical protein APR54_07645 [Candidatus Cloacimonas sp. SDB]|nr:MAG: hypothetical protein APR54_07645 [Candidatus Cloacimonas sp. SDB]